MATTFFEAEVNYDPGTSSHVEDAARSVTLTSFYGGEENGRSLQLSLSDGRSYVALTNADAMDLACALMMWARTGTTEKLSAFFGTEDRA
jgi:hypothetical protein